MAKNIFERENTEVEDCHLMYEDRFLRPQVSYRVDKLPSDQPVYFATQSEHRLQLRLFIQFRANRAQYDRALEQSKTAMLHFLYKDALSQVSAIRKYAMDGNRDLIFEACDKLDQAMGLR